MERAMELARSNAGFASPNPTVGCVLTDAAGNVLGEGAHRYAARDHAEIVALKQAAAMGRSTAGATAYVTLEPCSHHGRTGPCADALVAAGIARCVIATLDPNPLVSGRGLGKLRAAGVETVVASGATAEAARRINDAFAQFIQTGRPFVTLKAALSVDGGLAPPDTERRGAAPHWLTGRAARSDVQRLRHAHAAIGAGIGTILADDPSLTDRTGLPREPLLRVVFDARLRTPLGSQIVRSAAGDLLILCAEDASDRSEAALKAAGANVTRVASRGGLLDLQEALQRIAQRGCNSLLLEAGSALNGAFLRAGLVDRVVLYYAERELGIGAIPFAEGFASPYLLQQQLSSVTRQTFPSDAGDGGEDVRIAGYLHDPWGSFEAT
jgi:diaminohydroxyphosphoribosylaminopyrimidine deaminase/5-amino-6-(5-phosphoribosylamino)uracil reductase